MKWLVKLLWSDGVEGRSEEVAENAKEALDIVKSCPNLLNMCKKYNLSFTCTVDRY